MFFTEYLKITPDNGKPFVPQDVGQDVGQPSFPECHEFPYMIWEKGTPNFWFISEQGEAFYKHQHWPTSVAERSILNDGWITEPLNPRFTHCDEKISKAWEGALEFKGGFFQMIFHDSKRPPERYISVTINDVQERIKNHVWKQIPPLPFFRKPKTTNLEDIFHTL